MIPDSLLGVCAYSHLHRTHGPQGDDCCGRHRVTLQVPPYPEKSGNYLSIKEQLPVVPPGASYRDLSVYIERASTHCRGILCAKLNDMGLTSAEAQILEHFK
jgi:hypothetical protein